MTARVDIEIDAGIATITMHQPERLNALNRPMLQQLLAHLEQAAADSEIGAVVLTGARRAFSSGGDLRSEGDDRGFLGEDDEADIAGLRALTRSAELLRAMPKLTIAAVNGPCAGAAFALACAADVRLATASALFVTAFVPAGLSGDFGGTWTLPRIVGEGRARELFLLSERIEADRALTYGLVSKVCADDEFAGAVRAVAERAREASPLAMAMMKQNLSDAPGISFSEALDREVRRVHACHRALSEPS